MLPNDFSVYLNRNKPLKTLVLFKDRIFTTDVHLAKSGSISVLFLNPEIPRITETGNLVSLLYEWLIVKTASEKVRKNLLDLRRILVFQRICHGTCQQHDLAEEIKPIHHQPSLLVMGRESQLTTWRGRAHARIGLGLTCLRLSWINSSAVINASCNHLAQTRLFVNHGFGFLLSSLCRDSMRKMQH